MQSFCSDDFHTVRWEKESNLSTAANKWGCTGSAGVIDNESDLTIYRRGKITKRIDAFG